MKYLTACALDMRSLRLPQLIFRRRRQKTLSYEEQPSLHYRKQNRCDRLNLCC